MEGASDRLVFYNVDLLDIESLRSAIKRCDGIFHTTSLVTDDLELMVQPDVEGTRNVIWAAAKAVVRLVVFTSSIGAVMMGSELGDDVVVD